MLILYLTLRGGAVQYGASGAIPGEGISLGIDAVILLDNKYDLFDGILLTLGVGIGYDFHVLSPKTEETHVLKSAEKHTRDYKKTNAGHRNRKKSKGSKAHKSSSGARHGGSSGSF